MELRHLRYFVAIAEEGSFTRASERLWVSQPGLSAQIRRLERELGTQLFDRHTRGVTLTAAGTVFLNRARIALSAADAAGATVHDLQTGVVGSVRLGIASGPQWSLAHVLLERFARECPGVELTVVESYGGGLWRDLRDGRVDALIAPAWVRSGDLRHLSLGAEPWIALMSATHHLADEDRPLEAEKLQGQRVAVTGHRDGLGYAGAVAELLDDFRVRVSLEPAPPEPALISLILSGRVLALTTAPTVTLAGVSARPLDPRRRVSFDLLSRDEVASPALDRLIELASNIVGAGRRPRLVAAA